MQCRAGSASDSAHSERLPESRTAWAICGSRLLDRSAVTLAEPSRRPRAAHVPKATLPAMLRVVVRVDAAGEWPVLVDDGDELPAGEGVSFRYVCDVSTVAEGNAVRSAWLSRRMSPEVRRALEEERLAGCRERAEHSTPPFPS